MLGPCEDRAVGHCATRCRATPRHAGRDGEGLSPRSHGGIGAMQRRAAGEVCGLEQGEEGL